MVPRKKNKRKAIQKAKRDLQPKHDARRIGTIGYISAGNHGLAMALLASGLLRRENRGLLDELRDQLKER